MSTERVWWYLSFAENGWRGSVIVMGTDIITACEEAFRLKINPGGQVLGLPIPVNADLDLANTNRLITNREEAENPGNPPKDARAKQHN